jgi:uncharacterized membrane protein HdeD (DUF308 family)
VIVLRGVCAVLLGIAALALPGMTLIVLVMLFGAYAFADGLLAIVAAARAASHDRPWWALSIEGVVGIGIGILTFFWPGLTAMTLLYLIAVWAILTGVLEIVAALRLRQEIAGEWILAVAGVLSIGFGVYVLANPIAGALAVITIVGVYALLFGVALIALGLRLRGRQHIVVGSDRAPDQGSPA